MDSLFQFTLKNKLKIIIAFKLFYFIYVIFLIYGIYSIYSVNDHFTFYLEKAPQLGQIALIIFCLAITPGILRRFHILLKIMSSLMLIRRHLGITTFLFAFGHYMLLRGTPLLFGQIPFRPGLLFELAGITALSLMSVMFFTSNDLSVRTLGKKWSALHKIVYIIVWLIFFHTALQSISFWSILIGVYAVLETVSLIYNYFRMKKQKLVKPVLSNPVPPKTV